jgi:hypothetical protein
MLTMFRTRRLRLSPAITLGVGEHRFAENSTVYQSLILRNTGSLGIRKRKNVNVAHQTVRN